MIRTSATRCLNMLVWLGASVSAWAGDGRSELDAEAPATAVLEQLVQRLDELDARNRTIQGENAAIRAQNAELLKQQAEQQRLIAELKGRIETTSGSGTSLFGPVTSELDDVQAVPEFSPSLASSSLMGSLSAPANAEAYPVSTGSFASPGMGARPDNWRFSPGDGLTISMLDDTSRIRIRTTLSALSVFSSSRPFVAGNPFFLLPASPYGLPTNTFDLHARQSNVTAILEGPRVWGLDAGGVFSFYLSNSSIASDTYGFLPAQAYGELKNQKWRFLAGLYFDVFSPRDPAMLPLSLMGFSGNPGSRRGQIRVERYWKPTDDRQHSFQFDISEPVSTYLIGNTLGQRLIEDNGWPNIEARYALGLGEIQALAGGRNDRILELGLSGVIGQLRNTRLVQTPSDLLSSPEQHRYITNVWGLNLDGKLAINERLGVVGELFIGQGLREYGAGIGQAFNSSTYGPVRTQGGWGEVYYYLTDQFHAHIGYGIDAPLGQDLAIAQMVQNQTFFNSWIWDINKQFQASFEFDYRKTNYISSPQSANLPLDAQGVLFYSQFLWRY